MSKREYLDALAREALRLEYERPGVGCDRRMKPHLIKRGWVDPVTWRLTPEGRSIAAELTGQHYAHINRKDRMNPNDFPEERPPGPRYYPNEDLSIAAGCAAVLILFAILAALILFP